MTDGVMRGACLCGAVVVEVSGDPVEVCHCHCTMCRKHHGAAFATFVRLRTEQLRWVQGRAEVVAYRSSEQAQRGFCGRCGSSVAFWYDPMPEVVWITAGIVEDGAERLAPTHHIFIADRAPWCAVSDGLPTHAAFPSGEGGV